MPQRRSGRYKSVGCETMKLSEVYEELSKRRSHPFRLSMDIGPGAPRQRPWLASSLVLLGLPFSIAGLCCEGREVCDAQSRYRYGVVEVEIEVKTTRRRYGELQMTLTLVSPWRTSDATQS